MGDKDLSDFIDRYQSEGRYCFLKTEIQSSITIEEGALRKALWRLEYKKRIKMVKRGFYVIIPLEYSRTGIIPPEWFISDLMNFLKQQYYVGLLSAAVLHGSSHQQPQEFHVIVPKPERDIRLEKLYIKFYKKNSMMSSPFDEVKTSTGYIKVSNPAVTALDLVAYFDRMGGYDRVLTVLQELSEIISPEMLVEAARKENQLSHVQRLGWLLDNSGKSHLVDKLYEWLTDKNPKRAPLDPSLPRKGFQLDSRWKVIVNTVVEGEI